MTYQTSQLNTRRVRSVTSTPLRVKPRSTPAIGACNRILRLLYEPAENVRAVWIMPVCAVDPSQPEEIETVDPMDVVADLSRVVDLVAFDPHCRERFAVACNWPEADRRTRLYAV